MIRLFNRRPSGVTVDTPQQPTVAPAPEREETPILRAVKSAIPAGMDHHERMRLRAAAFRATRVYPGPVGELVSKELLMWEQFGYRLGDYGSCSFVTSIVDQVMTAPLPTPPPAAA